jgi:signal transduction histidine kinase
METVAIIAVLALAGVLAVRELTWRRDLAEKEEELHAARALIREREQLANLSQLVSGLAQELKSPLQGVIGNTELLMASATPGTESANDIREIQENAARAAGIVRNLLAFTETTTLSCRWQNINEIVRRAVDGCRNELEASGVRVQVEDQERLPLVYVDGRQLEKVICTLLCRPSSRSSARREAATVTLATHRRSDADDRLVIEVDDRTAGDMSDEASWSGDLEACRRIVEAHGGALEVERARGRGYRFHLELPVTAGGTEVAAAG